MPEFFHDDELSGKAYDSRLMKRLLIYLKPYRKYVILAAILLLVGSALQLLGPVLIKYAIDNYIATKDVQGLGKICAGYFVLLVLSFLLTWAQIYAMEWVGQMTVYNMRMQLFSHLQTLNLKFYDRNPVGRILTRVTSDINALNDLLSSGVVTIIGDVVVLVGIVGFMLAIDFKLALVTLTVLPLLIFAAFMFRAKVRETYREVRRYIAQLNAFIQEHISGMTVVQYFVQEAKILRKFKDINHKLMKQNHRSVLYYAVFFPLVRVLSAVSLALIIWYGGGEVIQGALTFGTLVAFTQYVERFYRPIMDLSEKYNILQSAMASAERVFRLLDTKPDFTDSISPVDWNDCEGSVRFENVSFAYNDSEWVLKDISFDIKPGEKVAIVGATGAGKTTISGLLMRFYDNQKGTILLDNTDIRKYSMERVRKQIGLVLQDVFLFSGEIEKNIRLGDKSITDDKLKQAASDVNLDRFVKSLPDGYKFKIGERGVSLSVGQKQLLSFARALAHDPRILILDEATSSVDTETEMLIQQALDRLMENRTSIIIAHRLSTIKKVDRILVLHKGCLRESGTHAELLENRGIYWKLYQLQYQLQNGIVPTGREA
ncbi:MAG: ABC transporter ATP-binding protein [Candidatus Zixiibacteriota bacterium]